MLTCSDLLRLPYTPDLTEAGITFACRVLASNRERMGDCSVNYLRRIAGGVAVELSFRRYLSEQVVPHEVLVAAPFTHPDQYDLSLGGHRCIIKSTLISRRKQISRLLQDPGNLLLAPALLPLDQFTSEDHKPGDLYLFAFLLGLLAPGQADEAKAIAAHQPVALIHLMPEAWAKPGNWIPLDNLALKSECGIPIMVEIGGLDAGRNFITVKLELPPRHRILVDKDFHSLAYILSNCRPEARIGIHSMQHGEPYLIPAHAWGNLWAYGMEILFAGWLTYAGFRQKACLVNAGASTLFGDRTLGKNLMVPISGLNPFDILLAQVKAWGQEKKVAHQVNVD